MVENNRLNQAAENDLILKDDVTWVKEYEHLIQSEKQCYKSCK